MPMKQPQWGIFGSVHRTGIVYLGLALVVIVMMITEV